MGCWGYSPPQVPVPMVRGHHFTLKGLQTMQNKISISINDFPQSDQKAPIAIEFGDKELFVKRRLGLSDTLGFVNDILAVVIDEDTGEYRPELLDFARSAALLFRFTNIESPISESGETDFSALFELVTNTDIVFNVSQVLNNEMLSTLYLCAEEKIDFVLCRMEAASAAARIEKT